MKTVKIMIMRQAVIDEVGKSTAYAGAKSTGDSAADFNRVATIEADDELLGRFWNEAAVAVTARLREFVASADYSGAALDLSLSLSSSYDDTQTPSVSSLLFSYMARSIIAKWYAFTLKEEAHTAAVQAEGYLADAASRCYWRKPPRRR